MVTKEIIRTVPEEGGFYDPPVRPQIEARHTTPANAYYKHCSSCAVLAWDVAQERQIPGPGKPIICWNCGTDNGRPALPALRWWERLLRRVNPWG